MIGKLTGLLDESEDNAVILNVGGVGYLVAVSLKTRQALPERGQALSLYIETHMREDALRLYGFLSRAERQCFQLLQNVPGVGAKLALAILGSLTPAELAQAVSLKDSAALTRAPGAGKKLAERLITELKGKLPAAAAAQAEPAAAALTGGETETESAADALSALKHLGYKAEQAASAVRAAAAQEPQADTAALIRLSLQILAKARGRG